jgi:hypothetical protein
MNLTMIVDALFWTMSILSAGFLAYGAWLCCYQLIADRVWTQPGRTRARSNWPRAARPV